MSEQVQRRLVAIVAADVVGYSQLVGADEEGTVSTLRARRVDIIEPLLKAHDGRLANTAGDSLLIEFLSTVAAVRFAIAMQQDLATQDDGPEQPRIAFRIGVNVGDVVVDGGDLLGDVVNIAARLEAIAPPGGIALSDDVYRHVLGRVDAAWTDSGEHALKNIAHPVRVWVWEQDPVMTGSQETSASATPLQGQKAPKAIAVLPFDNMSGDSDQDYFADGVTEDIITEISRIPDLMVISRNSTAIYKGKAVKVQDICRDLDVRYLLEGSVRKAGNRVRVTAQLIDGASAGHLWAERYDRELADVFVVQDDVTAQIVRALKVQLVDTGEPRMARRATHNQEAYDAVLRGREQYRLFTVDGNATARALFQEAVDRDPDYAEPYAGLAETFVHDWLRGAEPDLDRALDYANKAAARDPQLPLVHEALSTVHLFRRQHAEAIVTARRWIELDPSNADAYATLAGALHFAGENDEIVGLIETAIRLNPIYPFFYLHYIGLAHLGLRELEQAAAAFGRAISRSPEEFWPHMFLAVCHAKRGDIDEARGRLATALRINPNFSVVSLVKLLPYRNEAEIDYLIDGLGRAGLEI